MLSALALALALAQPVPATGPAPAPAANGAPVPNPNAPRAFVPYKDKMSKEERTHLMRLRALNAKGLREGKGPQGKLQELESISEDEDLAQLREDIALLRKKRAEEEKARAAAGQSGPPGTAAVPTPISPDSLPMPLPAAAPKPPVPDEHAFHEEMEVALAAKRAQAQLTSAPKSENPGEAPATDSTLVVGGVLLGVGLLAVVAFLLRRKPA